MDLFSVAFTAMLLLAVLYFMYVVYRKYFGPVSGSVRTHTLAGRVTGDVDYSVV